MSTEPQTRATDDAVRRRYGGDPTHHVLPESRWTETLRGQLGHRSVRAFADRPVEPEMLTTLIAAAQSAPTSSNLQAWSVVALTDPARKSEAARLCGEQEFIREAPVFLLWVADLARTQRLADDHDRPLEGADFLEATLVAVIDASLAAQNAVVAAESLGLGTVYVGGARNHPQELADLVGLPDRSFVAFGLAVGHPDPERPAAVKPRLPISAVLHHETYDGTQADAGIADYDATVGGFYAGEGMVGQWTGRVLNRLATAASLKGRDRLAGILRGRGLTLR